MVFRKSYLQIFFRVILIVGSSIALAYSINYSGYIHTTIVMAAVILILTLELLYYLNRTHRQLTRFFASLVDKGSSIKFDKREKTGSYQKLLEQMEEVNTIIQTERMGKFPVILFGKD